MQHAYAPMQSIWPHKKCMKRKGELVTGSGQEESLWEGGTIWRVCV